MSGGRLFEATIVARVPASVDLDAVRAELERLAAEVQVDITSTKPGTRLDRRSRTPHVRSPAASADTPANAWIV